MTSRDTTLPQVHTVAWAAAGALVVALIGPWLFSKGIFWDGAIYATIARNMVAGLGDAWHPQVTSTFMRNFHEHPPLAFWLEACFFRVLGDHFWVERIYSLVMAAVTWSILLATWRWLLRDVPSAAACCWLALVLWAPWGTWCYRHNMLENTMGVFTALSIYAALRATESAGRWAAWSVLAGAALTAAVLAKGPVGLFPAVTPMIAYCTLSRLNAKRVGLVQCGVWGACLVTFGLVLLSAASREYLSAYWHDQVLSSLRGQRERSGSPFGQLNIMVCVMRELRIPAAVACGLSLMTRRWKLPLANSPFSGPFWFCLVTALSASAPLALSPKQGGHYTAPSWPYYSFAVALVCLPAVLDLLPRIAELRPLARRGLLAAIVVAAAFPMFQCVENYGRAMRDQGLVAAADQLGAACSPGAIMEPSGSWHALETSDQLKLHVYLYRYYFVSLFIDEPHPAFNLECHRLARPEQGLVVSSRQVVTTDGVVGHLYIADHEARLVTTPGSAARR
ncbi:MAG TPA: glycosyltransferase family 39 protein [Pirellulales bacterium]|jgi:4-amino-4-deoxy-L-arabinose transferase-like glycosyltransferase|nr:glycosyltransferase family 39 protein [Pirellulales bacterium]